MTDLTAFDPAPGQPAATRASFQTRFFRFVRRSVASVLWAYIFIKLFVFDFDIYLADRFSPYIKWLLDYKLFVIFVCGGVIAALLRKWYLLGFLCYLVFFPLILLVWTIPTFIYKSKRWTYAIVAINRIISVFYRFRTNAVLLALFSISLLMVVGGESIYSWTFGAVGFGVWLGALLLIHFVNILKTDEVFSLYKKVFRAVSTNLMNQNRMDTDLVNIPISDLTPTQIETRTNKLQISLLTNRVCYFVAKNLRTYQQSGVGIVADVVSTIFLVFSTIVAMSFINYCLFKIFPLEYIITNTPTGFTFIYYSFNNYVFGSISELNPTGVWSQSLSMIERLIALLTGLIFVSMLFTRKSEKQAAELSDVIKDIEAQGREMEQFIQAEFRLVTVDDAIAEIERVKGGMLQVILWLSNRDT